MEYFDVMFLYSAVSSPLDRSKRFTLPPGRPVHSDTNSASPGSILATQQLRRLFTHISTTVYSQVLIYRAESTKHATRWKEMKGLPVSEVEFARFDGCGQRFLAVNVYASPATSPLYKLQDTERSNPCNKSESTDRQN